MCGCCPIGRQSKEPVVGRARRRACARRAGVWLRYMPSPRSCPKWIDQAAWNRARETDKSAGSTSPVCAQDL